jgi:anaerobic magnesium-protoporphyrin IX monomethyl ester cyclase
MSKIKKITLVQPSHFSRFPVDTFAFPYGLGYISAILIEEGYDVEIFDIHINKWNKEEVIQRLSDIDCDILGISALSTQYNYVKWFCEEFRNTFDISILTGGLLSTYNSEIVLEHTKTDICVIGEAENTIIDILKNMDDLTGVNGISYKNYDNKIIANPIREESVDVNKLPMPAYHLFDMEKYIEKTSLTYIKKQTRTMGIITGRGCPYNCTFCSKSFKKFRLRTADNVIKEIKYLIENYDVNAIHFLDELLISSKRRAEDLCAKMKPLNVIWDCQGRVNTVDYNILRKMKDAGCVSVGFGIESGSQKILDKMKKKITVKQSEEAMKNALKAGLEVKVQMIFGYPGENRETINDTIKLFKKVCHPGRRFLFITPIPGSPLYNELIEERIIEDEEKYLLELGYEVSGTPTDSILLNQTEFSDEELIKLKLETERKILINFYRNILTQPLMLIRYAKIYSSTRSIMNRSTTLTRGVIRLVYRKILGGF